MEQQNFVDRMADAVLCAEQGHDWREFLGGERQGVFYGQATRCWVCGIEKDHE